MENKNIETIKKENIFFRMLDLITMTKMIILWKVFRIPQGHL